MPYVFVILWLIRENLVHLYITASFEKEAVGTQSAELGFEKVKPKIKTPLQYCKSFSLSYVDA